jgi:hypothetical protein
MMAEQKKVGRKFLVSPPLHKAILDPIETRGNRNLKRKLKAKARNRNIEEYDVQN